MNSSIQKVTTSSMEPEEKINNVNEEINDEEFDDEDDDSVDEDCVPFVPCVYCHKEVACEHLLYDFDACFGGPSGGREDDLKKICSGIPETFMTLVAKSKKKVKFKKKSAQEDLVNLWQDFRSGYKEGNEMPVYHSGYMYLIHNIIENDLSKENVFTHQYNAGGGAGSGETVMLLCYAENPDEIIEKVRQRIAYHLLQFQIYFNSASK